MTHATDDAHFGPLQTATLDELREELERRSVATFLVILRKTADSDSGRTYSWSWSEDAASRLLGSIVLARAALERELLDEASDDDLPPDDRSEA